MGEFQQVGAVVLVSPDGSLASRIATIWSEVLGLEAVAADADFFELGGDSLAAVRMLAAVDEVLRVQVSFTDFLDGPTVAGLASAVQRAGEQPAQAAGPNEPISSSGHAPCSFAQERLWFLEQLGGSTAAYNMPIGARLRGPLDVDALERALREIVRRHAALRTVFKTENGRAVQITAPEAGLELSLADLRNCPHPEAEAERIVDELASMPFNLEHGPLLRAKLLRLADREHVVELVFHHIVCDGWSHVIVMRELGLCYEAYARGEAPVLPRPRVQFPDYARRQRATLNGAALEHAVAPWLQRLADAPTALDLPTDYPRPTMPSYRGATHRMRLSMSTAAAVRSFARAVKATPFATLLAAYYVLLHRYSGQDDIVVGATTSGRATAELDDGVGLFASTVALRGDLSEKPSFREFVARVRDIVLWAIAHEQAPFEQIVARLQPDRNLSRHALFQVFCAQVPHAPRLADGADFDARPATSRFDLTLFVEEEGDDGLELAWEYSSDLFDAGTIDQMARHYLAALEAALAEPECSIDDIPLLDEAEQREALAAGREARTDYPVACMHNLFEQQAAQTPDAVAVTFDQASLTYRELNERANQLARHLQELGAAPGTLVALYLEPSLELVVSVLGVLKSGAAYVPLDPEHPSQRLGFVLADARAAVLVTHEQLMDRLPEHEATIVCLEREAAALSGHSPADPDSRATPETLAYVIYTSGSTGRPKGVQVEHGHIARLFSATDEWFGFGPSDTWMMVHSYAFDVSVWEFWGALSHGGRLVVSPFWTTRSPPALAELVATEGATVLCVTPSLFTAVQDELLKFAGELALRFVVFAGEVLQPASLRPWFDRFGEHGARLINMYGITETTVHSTYRQMRAADCASEVSPIGVPIPDLSLYLLDPKGRPVPPGVAGELYVGGAGVTRGYLNRPELTAERFLQDPFGTGRLYRSGDIARRLPNGELEFRGRIDDQVKIRGFRIELGEIQAAIREVDGVADAAVLALKVGPGDMRIASYVVPNSEPDSVLDGLPAHLQARLPGYMVPASIALLDTLPLTRNGKLDRRALPPPTWEKQRSTVSAPPRTPTETLIAEVWREVLEVDQVGLEDNFFNLGGHSLLAARVVTQVRERCLAEISVRALFAQPTLGGFAAQVDSASVALSSIDVETAVDRVVDRPVTGEPVQARRDAYPLSFPQQQLMFFDQLTPGSVTYNAALATRVSGELDPGTLRKALTQVFERHEALRTVIVWDEASPSQVVLDDWTVELPVVDLSKLTDGERDEELERLLREHARRPFDLSSELMLRTTLFRLHPSEHAILFAPHHIAFDAWAVDVLYREVGELYDAARAGRSPRLPEVPLQYHDFAVWQRDRLRGDLLDAELDFWQTQLAGAPTVLRLPTDRPRPSTQTFEGATDTILLHSGLAERLREVCSARHATPYMLLLAAFATLLYRRTGQDDILLGGPMANRDQPEFENLVGFFANTVVVRVRLGGNPSFSDLLARVRDSVLESYEHQEVPFELVVDALRPARDPGVNPLFQVNFRVRVGEPPVLKLAGAKTTALQVDLGLARFDLALELHLLDGGLAAEFNWNTVLFGRETIERLAADFESLLAHGLSDPDTRLLSFELAADSGNESDSNGSTPRERPIRGFRGAIQRSK